VIQMDTTGTATANAPGTPSAAATRARPPPQPTRLDFATATAAASAATQIMKPTVTGLHSARLILWDDGHGWGLWLATVTQAGPLSVAGLLCHGHPKQGEVLGLSIASQSGNSASHPVRVGWLSTVGVGGGGHLPSDAALAVGRGNRLRLGEVFGGKFARTSTYDRVDPRLVGPQVQFTSAKSGNLTSRSKLLLEAALLLLVKNKQIG
jgi:hypothetical protein